MDVMVGFARKQWLSYQKLSSQGRCDDYETLLLLVPGRISGENPKSKDGGLNVWLLIGIVELKTEGIMSCLRVRASRLRFYASKIHITSMPERAVWLKGRFKHM